MFTDRIILSKTNTYKSQRNKMGKGKNSFLYFVNVACCFCLHKYKLKIKFALKINKSDKNL